MKKIKNGTDNGNKRAGRLVPDAVYNLATVGTHTVREFVTAAFYEVEIKIEWRSASVDERGYCSKTIKLLVDVKAQFFRPAEVKTWR